MTNLNRRGTYEKATKNTKNKIQPCLLFTVSYCLNTSRKIKQKCHILHPLGYRTKVCIMQLLQIYCNGVMVHLLGKYQHSKSHSLFYTCLSCLVFTFWHGLALRETWKPWHSDLALGSISDSQMKWTAKQDSCTNLVFSKTTCDHIWANLIMVARYYLRVRIEIPGSDKQTLTQ